VNKKRTSEHAAEGEWQEGKGPNPTKKFEAKILTETGEKEGTRGG